MDCLPPDCHQILQQEGWTGPANPSSPDNEEWLFPLGWALENQKRCSLDALMAAGIDPTDPCNSDGTPGISFATYKWPEAFPVLMAFCRDLQWKNASDDGLLHLAARVEGPALKDLLASDTPLDLNARNAMGFTPLMIACRDCPVHVPLLLEHGADPTIASAQGWRTLDLLLPDVLSENTLLEARKDAFIALVVAGGAEGLSQPMWRRRAHDAGMDEELTLALAARRALVARQQLDDTIEGLQAPACPKPRM